MVAIVEAARTAVRCDVKFCEFYGRVKSCRGGRRRLLLWRISC